MMVIIFTSLKGRPWTKTTNDISVNRTRFEFKWIFCPVLFYLHLFLSVLFKEANLRYTLKIHQARTCWSTRTIMAEHSVNWRFFIICHVQQLSKPSLKELCGPWIDKHSDVFCWSPLTRNAKCTRILSTKSRCLNRLRFVSHLSIAATNRCHGHWFYYSHSICVHPSHATYTDYASAFNIIV